IISNLYYGVKLTEHLFSFRLVKASLGRIHARSPLNHLLVALVLIGGCAMEGQSSPERVEIKLPTADPRGQAWIGAVGRPTSMREHFEAIEKVVHAREDRSLTEEVWITQCMIFLSHMQGEEELGAVHMLAGVSQTYTSIDPVRVLTTLAPYLDGSDRKV